MATDSRAEAVWNDQQERWVLRVQMDGKRKAFYSSTKGYKGRREVEAKADSWLRSGTAERRFCEAWQRYLEHVQRNTGTGNHINIERQGRLYLIPTLRQRKLSSITRNDWQACITEMAERGLSARTCRNVISTINAFLTFCDGENWEFAPIKKPLTIPPAAVPEKPKQALQPPELRTLFEDPSCPFNGRIESAFYIHAWRLLVATGLRRGELAGLRREDVTNVITIKRSINQQREETHGKNDNARRTMALTSIAAGILDDQRAMLDRLGIESDWIFPNQYGECSDPSMIAKHWRKYREYHGITCSIHELRHTFVSINKIEMPIELLKSVVGHSASMDTIGVYGHELEGEKQLAAQYVDSAFLKILDKSNN
jgi:integrase